MTRIRAIEIHVTPQNPVQYLACCGIFEIVCRFDETATGRWMTAPQPRFAVESRIDEPSLMKCLVEFLTDWTCWKVDSSVGGQVVKYSVTFRLDAERRVLVFDWWYETLNRQNEIHEKSAWKMYAGQQTADRICRDMVRSAAEILKQAVPETLSGLIKLNQGMSGRFGFDPRSSRNALDTGFSANDLGLPMPTYPVAELLAVIGAQYFFPHRTRSSGGNESTRGWSEGNRFIYGLWTIPLPILPARAAASLAAFDDESIIFPMCSERASRDRYSNLTPATPTTLPRNKHHEH